MITNILLDKLPQITQNGLEIDTDFRTSIKFELLMQDNKIFEKDKVLLALNLYYDLSKIKDINVAIKDMLWFYRCGRDEKKELISSENNDNSSKQIYNYQFDADYIFDAFLEQYQINLNRAKGLHWWEFKAMFNGLNENTQISKIMGYRAIDLSKIKDKETKNHYKKLKKLYGLPDIRTTEEKEKDFGSVFW